MPYSRSKYNPKNWIFRGDPLTEDHLAVDGSSEFVTFSRSRTFVATFSAAPDVLDCESRQHDPLLDLRHSVYGRWPPKAVGTKEEDDMALRLWGCSNVSRFVTRLARSAVVTLWIGIAAPGVPAAQEIPVADDPAVALGDGVVVAEAEARQAHQGNAELRMTFSRLRNRISDLDSGCGLSVKWKPLELLFQDMLASLKDEAGWRAEAERERAVVGLLDLEKFIGTVASFQNEVCGLQREIADRVRTERQHRQDARQHLMKATRAIRGAKFPYSSFQPFDVAYRQVTWHTYARETQSALPMNVIRMGKRGGDASRRAKYEYLKQNVSVDDGVVRVSLPAGQQSTWWRYRGTPTVAKIGCVVVFWGCPQSGVTNNRLSYGVEERIGALHLSWFERKSCGWGNRAKCRRRTLLRRLDAARGGDRLSTMIRRQAESWLQARVTAACKHTLADQEKLQGVILEHRPADPQAGRVYTAVSERFRAELGLLARSGEDEICSPTKQKLITGLVDAAFRDWERMERPTLVPILMNEGQTRSLQRILDRMHRAILDVLTPPTFLSPTASNDRRPTDADPRATYPTLDEGQSGWPGATSMLLSLAAHILSELVNGGRG